MEQINSTLQNLSDDGNIDYELEVDLKYPTELHDLHNAYPLAPERMAVTSDMLSDYQKALCEKFETRPNDKIMKLIPNLYDKTKYVTHYRNLKFYVQHGLIVTKVHRVMQFEQSRWLEPYISFNTEHRKRAKNPEDKAAFKLYINSIFGRTIMNLRKRIDIKLCTDAKKAKNFIAKPNFDGFKIVNEDLTMIKMNKNHIKWTAPSYVGQSILELSKLHMYDFHYNVVMQKYGTNAKLLFTDTDSLCYHIHTPDVYADMAKDLDRYDTSDYPPDHFCHSKQNCKVLGCFKDECNSLAAVEFVGLRAKMYSLLLPDKSEKKTAKGVKASFVKHNLQHQQYVECLREEVKTQAEFYTIRSDNHQLKTHQVRKDALNPYDDKRYIVAAGVHETLAYGHKACQ